MLDSYIVLKDAEQEYKQFVNEDGSIHYEGALGTFDYDPKVFELTEVEQIDVNTGDRKNIQFLKYIGSETDGSKIKIPEGLENGFMTFMNSNIQSMPKLPNSLKYADAMFQNCLSLDSINSSLPEGMRSSSFMFAGCRNLTKGPMFIPESCSNASFMFTNCRKLQDPPVLRYGLKYADFMFANCESLRSFPQIPKSLEQNDNMFANCIYLEDKTSNDKRAKDREKLIKRINKPTMTGRIGRAFSAIMQIHALRQMGYGMFRAPLLAYGMRRDGAFTRDFAGGLSALAAARPGGIIERMSGKAVHSAKMRQKQKNRLNREKIELFDRLNRYGNGSARDYQMSKKVVDDMKSGLCMNIYTMSANEKLAYQAKYSTSYEYREMLFDKVANSNKGLSSKDKENMAQWIKDELSAVHTYYKEGVNHIKHSADYQGYIQKQQALGGLNEISKLQVEPMLEMIERMDAKYQLFSDADMRFLSKMVDGLPLDKDVKKRFKFEPHLDMMDKAYEYANLATARVYAKKQSSERQYGD